MLRVYLLRHGETQYNADGNRYCGRTDIDLTAKGLEQAAHVNILLKDKKIDAVYSSPLLRARKTAEIASGRKPVTDERLIEIDFGSWEGKTREQFTNEDPVSWQEWMERPEVSPAGKTGEKGGEIVKRMNTFFEEMKIKHQNQNILVVAHNGVNRFFLAQQLGMPLQNYRRIVQQNSAITIFELNDENEFTLNVLNG
jgi:broad specificity phosphatase PhoE